MKLKLKILLASIGIVVFVLVFKMYSKSGEQQRYSVPRGPAEDKDVNNDRIQFTQTELSSMNQAQVPQAQKDFIKDYQAKTEIRISDDQILLISESVDAIPSHLYQENFGEKVTEHIGHVEFRPSSLEGEHLPVVFNELLQLKGYLTGYLSYFYQSEADKKWIIEQATLHNGKVTSVDEDTRIITVKYANLETLKLLMKVYPHFDVRIKYAPIVPH